MLTEILGFVTLFPCRSDCDSLLQLAEAVNKSACSNVARLYAGGQGWKWFGWKAILSKYFRKLSGIRKYSYFRFHKDQPWVMHLRERIDNQETTVCLLKRGVDPPQSMDPDVLTPPGLSLNRQQYN